MATLSAPNGLTGTLIYREIDQSCQGTFEHGNEEQAQAIHRARSLAVAGRFDEVVPLLESVGIEVLPGDRSPTERTSDRLLGLYPPPSATGDTTRPITFRIHSATLDRVRAYQREHGQRTDGETLRELIEAGLAAAR